MKDKLAFSMQSNTIPFKGFASTLDSDQSIKVTFEEESEMQRLHWPRWSPRRC